VPFDELLNAGVVHLAVRTRERRDALTQFSLAYYSMV
jgi:hypothetical protein